MNTDVICAERYLSLFKFHCKFLSTCELFERKSIKVFPFGIKIKHGSLFESKQHSQRKQQSQTGQLNLKKKKWSNLEIRKLIEEGRTCL